MFLLHYPFLDKLLAMSAVVFRSKFGVQRPPYRHASAITCRVRERAGDGLHNSNRWLSKGVGIELRERERVSLL